MSNSNDPTSHLSEREKSELRWRAHKNAENLKRTEEALALERKRFKTEELTADELENMKNREKLVKLRREFDNLKDQSSAHHYSLSDNSKFLDTQRQEDLFNKKTTIRDEFKTKDFLRSDKDWDKENAMGITSTTPAVDPSALFEKINLVLQKNARMKGNTDPNTQRTKEHNDELAMNKMSDFEKIQYKRRQLPAFQLREELLQAIRENQVLVIEGETGSGKTTQIMQYLYEDGYCEGNKIVACTQPRRVAAMSVAARVAVEKGFKLGEEVGYNVRFDNNTSPKTVIKYLTDGMLLRELLTSPNLDRYSVIMIDEAHERTISTDILIGILKPLLRRRTDLKVLIASATINIDKFCKYFNNARTFKIPGRTCNIDIYHTQFPEADYIDAATATTMQIHCTQPLNGDILVFLPGQEEIENMNALLNEAYRTRLQQDLAMPQLMICPIFANLPAEDQARIFMKTPENTRKVILATNIAETSLTIDGIVYVIDCGWCKTKLTNMGGQASSFDALVVTPISKASANQRAGRAGRIRDGKCFRLYTVDAYEDLPDQNIPEIQRSDLCAVILLLKSLNVNDLVNFDFIDPPSAQSLAQSLALLYALGAIAVDGRLTKVGYTMSLLPLEPMLAKAMIKSENYKCAHDIIKIAAMLTLQGSVFVTPSEKQNPAAHREALRIQHTFYSPYGDPFTLLNVYRQFENELSAQNELLEEEEQQAIFNPGRSKQNILEIKQSTHKWCRDNFVQLRLLERARDVVLQLQKMAKDVKIPYAQHQYDYDLRIKYCDERKNEAEKKNFVKDYENRVRLTILHGYFPNIASFMGSSTGSNSTYSLLKRPTQIVFVHPASSLYKPSNKELRDKQRRQQQQIQTQSALGDAADTTPDTINRDLDQISSPPQYIIYHELMRTKKEYIRGCMSIEPEWIVLVASHYYPAETQQLQQALSKMKRK